MSERKLYMLTDEEAHLARIYCDFGANQDDTPKQERKTCAEARRALTPLDRDDAIERMARAILQTNYGGSVDLLSHNAWDVARGDARAALEALTKENQT